MMAAVACGGAAAAAACKRLQLCGERELRFLGLSRQLFPQRPLFALTFGPLFGIQARARFGFRLDPGGLGGRAEFIDDLPKTRHLFMESLRRGGRIGGRNEGTGLERLVDEGPEIPNAELTRDFERGQCLRMIAAMGMRRLVADDPHLVKEIGDLGRNHPLEFEAPEQVRLRFVRAGELSGFRSGQLGQQFAELPKFDQAGVRIIAKISLGQCAKARELHVMLGQEPKVRRLNRLTSGDLTAHAAAPNRSVTFFAAVNFAKLV